MSNPTLTTSIETLTLYLAQDDTATTEANVNADSPPTFDSEEAILTALTKQEQVEITGIASANRISNDSKYSSDPLTALAEWVQDMMKLVNGGQGSGYTLDSTERNRSFTVAIEEFTWTQNQGNRFQVEWSATLRRGDVAMVDTNINENVANPVDPDTASRPYWSLSAGNTTVDLQELVSVEEVKQQPMETAAIAMADTPDENLVIDDEGATRRVIIRGEVSGDKSTRNSFDSDVRSLAGGDTEVTYASAFPGHSLDCVIQSFEPTRQAGWTRLGEYGLELVEGTTL